MVILREIILELLDKNNVDKIHVHKMCLHVYHYQVEYIPIYGIIILYMYMYQAESMEVYYKPTSIVMLW